MVMLPRQSLLFLVSGLVLVFVLTGLLLLTPVRADVGVQPVLPGGSSIRPEAQTPIQMAAEVIVMTVRLATAADNALVTLNPDSYGYGAYPSWYPGIAEVEADFKMLNPTSEAVRLTVWFPLASALDQADWNFNPGEVVPRIASFRVSVDGNPLDYAVSELPNPQGADKPPLPWASFPVTFPGGKETAIHASYILPLQPSVKGNEMALYYIFQTGAGWAGPIGQAELIINLPYLAAEGTLAAIAPGRLYLPPVNITRRPASLPPGVRLEGNQARWVWKDFEPGPENDLAVWLLRPAKWQELESARLAVQANALDGQAWLDLASTYTSLSCSNNIDYPLLFSASYLPPGIAAYQKAVDLLPDHPAVHAGLALLTLTLNWNDGNPPPKVIQFAQDEYLLAKDLAAKNPGLAQTDGNTGALLHLLESAFSAYYYNDATATMEAATRVIENATMTARATVDHATTTAAAIAKATHLACWATAGPACLTPAFPTNTPTPHPALTYSPTPTTTPIPSATPQPVPTTLSLPGQSAVRRQNLVTFVAAGIATLVVVGYLALSRSRKSPGK